MELIIAELARYVILILFAIYTLCCFRAFTGKATKGEGHVFRTQRTLTITMHLVCYLVLIIEQKEIRYVVLWALELFFYVGFIKIYQVFYKGINKLVLNNMMMCLMIGFILLSRLEYEDAVRQLLMAAVAMGVCLLVPLFIERFTIWEKIGWQYAIVGIAFLMLVFVIGVEINGAKNWISIGGFAVQPSEFVKIIYVFFIASLLAKSSEFKHLIPITIVAGVHVIILVAEKDLGAALIYFVTYLMVLYVATMRIRYLFAGVASGSLVAVIAYHLFSHVQVRVLAWSDPWSHINNEGYQICQSLFAIGTGGLFGMGLGQGLPDNVPVVESDFIFAAISEELGVIFAVCLLLVYISSFIMFVNIALKMKNPFYKLTAFGLSVMFIFQVFLNVGGVTKFIPSTGVTLPLISYGGSSVVTTIVIFSIIQGMYVKNKREEDAKANEAAEQAEDGGSDRSRKRRKKTK